MKNNINTFIWVTTALLVILITPQLYIDYEYSTPNSEEKLTREQLTDLLRSQDPEYYKDWGDDQLLRVNLREHPELADYLKPETVGERLYTRFGDQASADFWKRFGFTFETQWDGMKAGLVGLAPWTSAEAEEKARYYAEELYRSSVAGDTELQAYLAWKNDKPLTNDFATFLRTLSESFSSIIMIGFPLFIISMFSFFFTSKNDMNEIIKKYGFDEGGFSKFNFEVKGIVGSFFKFFICWYLISKSILVAGIEIIGVSRKQKESLKPQEIELKTNAKTFILTFMQAEGVILFATFSYFVFQSY